MKHKTKIVATLVCVSTLALALGGCTNKSTETKATTSTATDSSAKSYWVIPDSEKNAIKKSDSETLKRVYKAIDDVYANNGVLRVVVGAGEDGEINTSDDNYIVQMYNEQGQCYSEASNNLVSFYYNRGKSVLFSTKVAETDDVTILDLVSGVTNLCNAGVSGCTIDVKTQEIATAETEAIKVDIDNSNTDETTSAVVNNGQGLSAHTETLVTLKVTGLDNIKKVYSQYSTEQGKDIENSWLGLYANANSTPSQAEEDVKAKTAKDSMTLSIYLTDGGDFSVSSKLSVDSQEYTSWVFDGYTALSRSWTAGDGWKAGLSDNEYLDLISKVQSNIAESMNEWKKEQTADNAEADSSADGTTAESTENSTEETGLGAN